VRGTRTRRSAGAAAGAGLALAWIVVVACAYYRRLAHPGPGDRLFGFEAVGRGGLPHFLEAALAAATALAGALLLLTSATVLGRWIAGLAGWREDDDVPTVALAAAVGAAAFAEVSLVLATVGLYRPAALRLAAALPLVIAIGRWGAGARRLRPSRRAARWWCSRRDAAFAACAGLAMGAALVAALAPEVEYDALWYHLYFPRLALEHGSLVDLPAEYVSLYPMSFGLWLGYGLALGGPGTAKLLHFACLPLAAALVHALVRRHAPAASAWLGVALFATAPVVMWEASTAYVDLALALYVTLGALALLRHLETGERRWLVLSAASLGFALASKHVALLTLAAAAVALAFALWRSGRGWRAALGSGIALVLMALLPALPWYARSAAATGDPVFPSLYRELGAPTERWDATLQRGSEGFMARFGRPRTVLNQLTLPWDMSMHPARYAGTLGPLFLVLLPLLALSRPSPGVRWVTLFCGLQFVLWASPLAAFQLRWLVPVLPLAAALGAAAHAGVVARLRLAGLPGRAAWRPALALLLLLNLPFFSAFHEADRAGRNGWLTHTLHGLPLGVVVGAETREAYLERHVPAYAAWRFVNASAPPDARLLVYGDGDHFYSRRERVWALSALARPVAFAPSDREEATREGLRRLGITHVLVSRDFLSNQRFDAGTTWGDFAATGARARTLWYEVAHEDDRTIVYRLRPDAPAPRAG
jgi:hypothetical protein